MDRSYLFAPGHNEKLLSKVFDAGADAVMLDLEDAVPPEHKAAARALVADVLANHPSWVRVNAARTDWCAADLQAVGSRAYGIRIPKTESAEDVSWVAERAPGKPIICAIESARGVLAAAEIAAATGVRHLAMGGVDMQRDLHAGNGNLQTLYVRSHLVVASRAAGIERPIDSVYPRLDDEAGLREQAEFALSLGFFGKSGSTRGNCRSCTRSSPRARRRWPGPGTSWKPSMPLAVLPCACPAANSSTCRSRSAPDGFWS
jgi:citrate lyase subunit beta / citryl-CoA lyase